jgi:hypothetical protein
MNIARTISPVPEIQFHTSAQRVPARWASSNRRQTKRAASTSSPAAAGPSPIMSPAPIGQIKHFLFYR